MIFDTITSFAQSGISNEFLKEGVKFLWAQLNEIIKSAKENKKCKIDGVPNIIDDIPFPLIIEPDQATKVLPDLLKIRKKLAIYFLDDKSDLTPGLNDFCKLQEIIEEVIGKKIRFSIPNAVNNNEIVYGDKIVQNVHGGIAIGKLESTDQLSIK